jgi:hypothetical protein
LKSNYLRAVLFEKPDSIPMAFHINDACWHHYPQQALFDLMEAHPLLFPGFLRPSGMHVPEYGLCARKDQPYADDFGCLWRTTDDGITGTVVGHPLASWDDYAHYRFPDPEKCMGIGPVDWDQVRACIEKQKDTGGMRFGGLRHGHTFLQLCDLRGYRNLIYDMADDEPLLPDLIEKLEAFNHHIVDRYLSFGVDQMGYADDLGMQLGPMLSPTLFRKYIKPSYQRLMKRARARGALVHMHSDGDIRDLADDLIDDGVQIINLQDLVNGIDWIRDKFAGKVAIDLDIDRSRVTAQGTPQQIDALIREEVRKLSTPMGGLTMIYGLYPGVPLENVRALMDAMEKYALYHS